MTGKHSTKLLMFYQKVKKKRTFQAAPLRRTAPWFGSAAVLLDTTMTSSSFQNYTFNQDGQHQNILLDLMVVQISSKTFKLVSTQPPQVDFTLMDQSERFILKIHQRLFLPPDSDRHKPVIFLFFISRQADPHSF